MISSTLLILKLVLRDSLRLLCMHAPLITCVGENPFPKVLTLSVTFNIVADDDTYTGDCDPNESEMKSTDVKIMLQEHCIFAKYFCA